MDRETYDRIMLDRAVQQFKEVMKASLHRNSFGTIVPKGDTLYIVNRTVAQIR